MISDRCPPPDQLAGLNAGTLDEHFVETVVGHLNDCSPCQDAMVSLGSSDTLAGFIRGTKSDYAFYREAAFQQAERLVRQIGREPSSLLPDAARPAEGHAPPADIGPYRLLEKLGEGGMGAVYKALHTRLNKVVAIKILPPRYLHDAPAIARFQREMQAVGTLDHPNIVRATDAGDVDRVHFLVMEYVAGINLAKLVARRPPLPISAACELIRQAAVGLQEIHGHRLVHRDIKPSNLILATQGHGLPIVKILDLGLATFGGATGSEGQGLTSTGQTLGTLDYMAPEQGDDSHRVDIRCDLYSLGATLYFLLCGEPVFCGQQYAGTIQKLKAIAVAPVPPIQERRQNSLANGRQDIPDELAAIVHRLLEKNPDARYASPGDVAAALEPFCAGADLESLVRDEQAGEQEAPAKPSPRTSAPAAPASAGGWIWLAALPLVLLLAWGVISLATDGGYLLIEADPRIEVSVEILREGERVETMKIGREKDAVWLRSGLYQIRIPAESTSRIEVSEREFRLTKGDKKIVTIRRVTLADANSATQPAAGGAAPAVAVAPFNAAQARQHQQAWADFLQVPVEYKDKLGMRFMLIPPGRFRQGNSREFAASLLAGGAERELVEASQPQHDVELTRPFYLGIYEVTQAQFESICGYIPEPQVVLGGDYPVCYGKWQNAFAFCNLRSTKMQLEPAYAFDEDTVTRSGGNGYRLPTEAEWEFACLAGVETLLTFDGAPTEYSRHDYNSVDPNILSNELPSPVGSLKPNRFGIFDMRGNLNELCQDYYQPDYYQNWKETVARDPQGPAKSNERVVRGAHYCGTLREAALRRGGKGEGFRVVLSVESARKR